MTNTGDLLEDPRQDDLGMLLNEFQALGPWNNAKRDKLNKIIEYLEKNGFKKYFLAYSYCPVGKSGNSRLYKVPLNKNGKLEAYRGKLIRLVSIGTTTYDCIVMLKILNE